MELLQTIFSIFVAILVFGFVIFAHELGHFLTAIWAGISVEEFSIGMGPKIFQFKKKNTLYSLRALPLGGFCKMEGEDGDGNSDNSFNKKPKWKRLIVLATGALANILMGFIIICFIYALSNVKGFPVPIVGSFNESSVSNEHGLLEKDKIISINNYNIYTFMDINYALVMADAKPVKLEVKRDGKNVILHDVEFSIYEDKNLGDAFEIDFTPYGVKKNFINTISYSFNNTISISRSIYSFIGNLIIGKSDPKYVSGPVGTTTAIAENVTVSISSLMLIVAMISINLGIVNLLPFPALDGGRIVLIVLEGIRKKPLSPKIEIAINATGLIILFGLMIIITLKDIITLF